jgi:hypothetical protein
MSSEGIAVAKLWGPTDWHGVIAILGLNIGLTLLSSVISIGETPEAETWWRNLKRYGQPKSQAMSSLLFFFIFLYSTAPIYLFWAYPVVKVLAVDGSITTTEWRADITNLSAAWYHSGLGLHALGALVVVCYPVIAKVSRSLTFANILLTGGVAAFWVAFSAMVYVYSIAAWTYLPFSLFFLYIWVVSVWFTHDASTSRRR